MTRPMDHLAEQISLYQHGRLSRRQLLERGAALGLSAAGLAALGSVNPVAGQERLVRPSIQAVAQEGATLRVALATAQKTGDHGPIDSIVARMERGAKELNFETKVVGVVQGEYTERYARSPRAAPTSSSRRTRR